MINHTTFPLGCAVPEGAMACIKAFEEVSSQVESVNRVSQPSDHVLRKVSRGLETFGFRTEKGKRAKDKIRFEIKGNHGAVNVDVDAYHEEFQTILEVEAGRAVVNQQFLKDYWEAILIKEVKHLVIAVRNIYAGKSDYDHVTNWFGVKFDNVGFEGNLETITIIGY